LLSLQRWICLGIALTVLTVSGGADAQVRAASLSRIKLLNKKAMDEYDSLEFEAAKSALLEAVAVAEGAKIERGKTLTATYLNLGIVFGAGLNDRINAIKYFTAALRISRAATLNPARATPSLEEMFKTAGENAAKDPPKPKAPPFVHTPVDEAVTGRRVKLYAKVNPVLNPNSVVVFYRITGSEDFMEVKMRQVRTGTWFGVIPARNVRGRSIYYYVEAMDETGDRLGGSGTATSPNIISIKRGPIGGSGPGQRRPPPKKPKPGDKVVSIAVMVGAGIGVVHGGHSEHEHQQQQGSVRTVEINPGGALSPFHIAPEVSYHINASWHVSLLGRIQVLNAISGGQESKLSLLGEVRAKRFFGDDALRFYLAFGAGAGQIRHRIPLGDYDEKDPNNRTDIVDSRVGGIVAFGLGGGLVYMFSSVVGLAVELNGLILVPDFAANLDANLGIVLSF
jgi:hypothetical protein